MQKFLHSCVFFLATIIATSTIHANPLSTLEEDYSNLSSKVSAPPTIVEPVKIPDNSSPHEIETLLKSERSPPTTQTSPFCPWGICKFPGFLFGAFFKVPDDMVPTPPPSGKTADNVIFINTHEEKIPDSEKTVIYLLPQKTRHSYSYKEQKNDLDLGESRNPFNDKFEVVYLSGSSGLSPESPREVKDKEAIRPIKSGARHVRRIMRRVIKGSRNEANNNNNNSGIVTSVSVSYSVSRN